MAIKRESKVKFGKPAMSIINGVVDEVVEVKIKDWGYSAIHPIFESEELEADFIIVPRFDKMDIEKGLFYTNYADNTALLKEMVKEGFGDTMLMEDEKTIFLIKFLDKKIGDQAAEEFIDEFDETYTIYQPVLAIRYKKNGDDSEPDKIIWINSNAYIIFDNEEDDDVIADEEVWFNSVEEAEAFIDKNSNENKYEGARYIGNYLASNKNDKLYNLKLEIWKSLRYPGADAEDEDEDELVIDTIKVDEDMSLTATAIDSDDEIEKQFKKDGGNVTIKFINEKRIEMSMTHPVISDKVNHCLNNEFFIKNDNTGQLYIEIRHCMDGFGNEILPRFENSIIECIKLLRLGIVDNFYCANNRYILVRYIDRGTGIGIRQHILEKYAGMKFMYTIEIFDSKEHRKYNITAVENQVVPKELNVRQLLCFDTIKEAEDVIDRYHQNANFVNQLMMRKNIELDNIVVGKYIHEMRTEFEKATESFSEPTMMIAKDMISNNNPTFMDKGLLFGEHKFENAPYINRYLFQVVPVTFITE